MPELARSDAAAERNWPGAPAMSRRAAGVAIAIITAFCLTLRLVGLSFQLPQFVPIDSLVLRSEVDVLRHNGDLAYRLHPNLYPQLIPRLGLLVPIESQDSPPPKTLADHLARASEPYLNVRLVVALLSVLVVPATYRLARRFMERFWAVAASALMATNILDLWFAQEGRPHSAAVSFSLLAILAALHLRRRPTLASYLFAGVAIGLAVGVLQSGIATLLPLAAAFMLRARKGPSASPLFAVASVLIAIAAIAYFYPTSWGGNADVDATTHPKITFDGSSVSLMGHALILAGFNGGGTWMILSSLWSYDPLILALAILGFVVALLGFVRPSLGLASPSLDAFRAGTATEPGDANRERRKDLLVVLAYCIPYLVVICLYENSAQRFAIPLLPFLACLAAYSFRAAWIFAGGHGRWARAPVTIAIAALLSVQAVAASKLSWIRSRPDTATQAADWIRAHVSTGTETILVNPGFALPLLETAQALEANRPMRPSKNQCWYRYQVASVGPDDLPLERYDIRTLPLSRTADLQSFLDDPASYLRSVDADWFVVEAHRAWEWGGTTRLRKALPQVGHLAARFSPDPGSPWEEAPIAHQGYDPLPYPIPWFWRILSASCTGPVLEIWKLGK